MCVCVCLSLSPSPSPSPSQPDGDAGDVIVILQEESHSVFKRESIDLVMEKNITLHEALCGCEFTIKHLDGQELRVKTPPGEVIAPGTLCTLCVYTYIC